MKRTACKRPRALWLAALGMCQILLAWPTVTQAGREVLRPEAVFRYAATADSDAIYVDWDIEDGYYLYRDKMSFSASGAELGPPQFPPGEIHEDEFFGAQVIYRGTQRVRIPLLSVMPDTRRVELLIKSQGCADFGLCYPPQKWTTMIDLPATAGASGSAKASGLAALGLADTNEPLGATQAFVPSVSIVDPFTAAVRWEIASGYYLYRKDFTVSNPGGEVQIGNLQLPQGVRVDDLEFGEVEVYFDAVEFRVPFTRASPEPQAIELALGYQGCKLDSICYPPGIVTLPLELPRASVADAEAIAPVSEQDRLFDVVATASLPTVMVAFLGLGLLLAFTPCCLPMVPILSGIIAGQGANVTTARSFWLSLSYVLGMAFTYTIAGAVVGAAGGQIQAALQTPLVLGFVAALFVALSLAMFGAYELQLPAALQTRLTELGNKGKAGSFVGTAFMGAISALVVSTCVAPPLVAALAVIAQTGDVARGAFALFALSIGMGIPLIVFGVSAGKLLPRAGAWMNTIKAVFGFMLLGLAIWMLDRVLPGFVTMLLWAALALFAGVWFGAFTALAEPVSAGDRVGKLVGLLAALYGVALLAGAFSGSTNVLQPLDRIGGSPGAEAHALPFERIKTVDDFEAMRTTAAAANKTLMLDFYADWCVSCKEMEAWTFTDEQVQAALEDTVLVQADVTANDEADQALLKHFGIFGPPTIVFFDRGGNEVAGQRVIGYMNSEAFLKHLDYVLR